MKREPLFFQKRPETKKNPMQRLADVELQLVMQGLAAQEILKLARCSRYLLHAADAPFAWQYTRLCFEAKELPSPPLAEISISTPKRIVGWCKNTLVAQKPPRLSRHAKVTIKWPKQTDSHLWVLAIASRFAAIYELDASCRNSYDPVHMIHVLSLPSMQQLRVVSTWGNTHTLMQAFVQLPYLHTLRLSDFLHSGSSGAGLLFQAPALTSLHIKDTFIANSSQLVHVAACSKLRHLSVFQPWLYGLAWPVFFAHPHIQQLHSLKVDVFFARGVIDASPAPLPQEYVIAFASMHHLHTLHLARCEGVDLMLPALAHAPAIRQLIIEPNSSGSCGSGLALATLLTAAPQLHCVLVLKPIIITGGPLHQKPSVVMERLRKRFESDPLFVSDQFTIE